jgi:hypothetical protein
MQGDRKNRKEAIAAQKAALPQCSRDKDFNLFRLRKKAPEREHSALPAMLNSRPLQCGIHIGEARL